MRIAIYTQGEEYITPKEIHLWGEICSRYSINCYINDTKNNELKTEAEKVGITIYSNVDLLPHLDLVVSYGGDGNFLYTIEFFREKNIPILGINSGRLGFLANVPRTELELAIEQFVNGNYTIEERHLIEVIRGEEIWYAFNEFTLQKRGFGMIDVYLVIDGEYVADYMADGLIISSPSGSTAYSMSVGGAIVAPNCNCFVITPIAPHNLNMRPLIVNDHATLEVRGESRNYNILATTDNRSIESISGERFLVKRSDYSVKLVKLVGNSFYKTIRQKLMWGVDARKLFISE